MPFTISHCAAVLPLRRFSPPRLDFAALVIGSMSPDFRYFLGEFPRSSLAHTFRGSFLVCLPIGLAALVVFNFLRKPLCYMLPQPHRAALAPLALKRSSLSFAGILISALSILLGAWTHIFWDSFTHRSGWFVRHISYLQTTAFRIGTSAFTVSYLLQQVSTIIGGAILIVVYRRWVRAHAPARTESDSPWRYLWIPVVLAGSMSLACLPAWHFAANFSGLLAFRVFMFNACIYGFRMFIPVLVVSAVVAFALRDKGEGRL